MLYDYGYQIPRNKFFSKETAFNGFADLTDERRKEIEQHVSTFLDKIQGQSLPALTRYTNVLDYLVSKTCRCLMPTFDEQLLFFILACDPNLDYLKDYYQAKIISIKEIENAPKSKKSKLERERSQQLHDYTRETRRKMGFYDSKLLKYESIYFDNIVRFDKLRSNIQSDATTPLLAAAKLVTNFTSITDEDFERIKAVSQIYRESVLDPDSFHTLSYNILSKKRKVNLPRLKEKFALLIYTIDPDLKILKIYEEESNTSEIERRVLEEFGYYHPELIRLERAYHKRFCPEKKISEWSDERKLLWTQD